MTVTLIVARGSNGVIGVDGALPWRLKDDMAFFKATTMGKPVLMGRKTWASIGRPLPGRPNLVVSRDLALAPHGAWVFSSLETGLRAAIAIADQSAHKEVCVIGGAEIYAQALPFADKIHLTEVDAAPVGNVVFSFDAGADWVESGAESFGASEHNDHAFTIRTLVRMAAGRLA